MNNIYFSICLLFAVNQFSYAMDFEKQYIPLKGDNESYQPSDSLVQYVESLFCEWKKDSKDSKEDDYMQIIQKLAEVDQLDFSEYDEQEKVCYLIELLGLFNNYRTLYNRCDSFIQEKLRFEDHEIPEYIDELSKNRENFNPNKGAIENFPCVRLISDHSDLCYDCAAHMLQHAIKKNKEKKLTKQELSFLKMWALKIFYYDMHRPTENELLSIMNELNGDPVFALCDQELQQALQKAISQEN